MPLPLGLGLFGAGTATFSLSALLKVSMVWFVVNIACKLVFRVLFSIGIGLLAFSGLDLFLDPITGHIQQNLNDLPSNLKGALVRMKVPEAIGILLSGLVFAFTTKLARSGIGFRGRPTKSQITNAW